MESLIPVVIAVIAVALVTILFSAGRQSPGPSDEGRGADEVAPTKEAVNEAPSQVAVRERPKGVAAEERVPAPEQVVEKPAVTSLARIAKGLQKTKTQLAERITALASRDKLDEEAWDEVEEALIRADVGVKASVRIVEKLRQDRPNPAELNAVLRRHISELLSGSDRRLRTDERPSVWIVVGVNGTGKTTSIAKLANLLKQQGKSTVIAAADTFRAAAIDQLQTWADRAGVPVVKHASGGDPSAVVFDAVAHATARGADVVIVDTAGRLHTKTNLMEELKKIRRVAEKQAGSISEVLLVVDATVGQNGIAQAKTFQEAVEVTGVILTKLDGTARGGIVVAIQEELGIPVKAVGVGESLEDLEPFDPELFAEALLG